MKSRYFLAALAVAVALVPAAWACAAQPEKGPVTVGFGDSEKTTGVELGIGMQLGDFYRDQQVLLIKSAWGGKSLKVDFLPPSAGGPGEFYKKTVEQTREALDNLQKHFPDYDGKGYEIAGMGKAMGDGMVALLKNEK